MDPNYNNGQNNGNNIGQNLPPQPMPETAPVIPGGMQPEINPTSIGGVESAAGLAAPATPPPAAPVTWLPPSVPVKPAGGTVSVAPSAPTIPDTADDGDVIEKEWVLKAKHIVDQTKQDPYKQTKELHKFRAEYMKKRYNKVIEPVEE